MKKTILVLGAAGYIGSHMVKYLIQHGHEVVAFDNLSTGHRDAVLTPHFIEADVGDVDLLQQTFQNYEIDVVMHFANTSDVAASMDNPGCYFENNYKKSLLLFDTMLAHGVKHIIFSSSAAVYGDTQSNVIDEQQTLEPINPYGESKRLVEKALQKYFSEQGLSSISLRYFNAAGCDPEGELGERHDPETHLIPLALLAAKNQTALTVYGDDYATEDGSCIRDYVHVWDICQAHLLALEKIVQNPCCEYFNLGSGCGYSVFDVIRAAEKVSQRKIPFHVAPPRKGDVPVLVASCEKAIDELGWRPEFSELETMIQHAWQWFLHNTRHPAA